MDAVVLYGLRGSDGRRVIEARYATWSDGKVVTTAESTFYSCAYDSPLGMQLALRRALQYIRRLGVQLLCVSQAIEYQAVWQ